MLARILGPASTTLIKRMSTDAKLAKIDSRVSNNAKGDSCKDKSLSTRLVWVDLEMTGLEIEKDVILEMACIVTDADLNVIAEADDLIIHHPDSVLDSMGEFCKKLHGKSGLTESVKKSQISVTEAEKQMVSFLQEHVPPGSCPLAGNTVHVDKEFLKKSMPLFMNHLHYRIIDVSTLKELCRRWYPEEYVNTPVKALKHRALDDIKESITELKYYRKAILK